MQTATAWLQKPPLPLLVAGPFPPDLPFPLAAAAVAAVAAAVVALN